jgi:hypothetical protein
LGVGFVTCQAKYGLVSKGGFALVDIETISRCGGGIWTDVVDRKEENRERLKRVLRGLDDVTGGGEDGSRCGHDKILSLLGMYASAKKIGGLGGFYTEEKKDDSERPAVDDLDDTTSSFPSTIHPYAVSAHDVYHREKLRH